MFFEDSFFCFGDAGDPGAGGKVATGVCASESFDPILICVSLALPQRGEVGLRGLRAELPRPSLLRIGSFPNERDEDFGIFLIVFRGW